MGAADPVLTGRGRCAEGRIFTPIRPVSVTISSVSPDTFQARGMRVLEGRGFAAADSTNRPRVAVISPALAQPHFEQQGALGRKIRIGFGGAPDDGSSTALRTREDRRPPAFCGPPPPP